MRVTVRIRDKSLYGFCCDNCGKLIEKQETYFRTVGSVLITETQKGGKKTKTIRWAIICSECYKLDLGTVKKGNVSEFGGEENKLTTTKVFSFKEFSQLCIYSEKGENGCSHCEPEVCRVFRKD